MTVMLSVLCALEESHAEALVRGHYKLCWRLSRLQAPFVLRGPREKRWLRRLSHALPRC